MVSIHIVIIYKPTHYYHENSCVYTLYSIIYATASDSQGLTLSQTTWVLSWSLKVISSGGCVALLLLDFAFFFHEFIVQYWFMQVSFQQPDETKQSTLKMSQEMARYFFLHDKCECMVSSKVLPTILMNLLLSCLLTLTIIFWRKPDRQSIPKLLIWKHYLIVKWVYEWRLLAWFVLYLCSYGLMSACIFVMYLHCFGNVELFPPVHSIFYSSLVFLNLTELVKEILGNQVLES